MRLPGPRSGLVRRSLAGVWGGSVGLSASLLTALLLLSLGCVSATEHRQVVDELSSLRQREVVQVERIGRLQAQERNLSEELAVSLEGFEDLRIEHQALAQSADQLRASERGLDLRLQSQSEQLELLRRDLGAARDEASRLASTYTTLMADLESEVSSGQIEIEQLREGVRVSVSDDIIFASGSAELDPLGRKVLEKVSQQLLALDHSIEVQGHTDDLGLKASLAERFPSNWDLAAARASRVVRLMEEQGIPGERMRVVSFASFQPLVPNESPESRAQNRRIEIRLKPKTSHSGEHSSGPTDGG